MRNIHFLSRLVAFFLLFASAYSHAGPERALLGQVPEIPLAFSTDPVTQQTLGYLRQQVAALAKTRIIVGLRVPFAPEGSISAAAVIQQRSDIATMQTTLVSKVFSNKQKPQHAKFFDSIPFMAFEVDVIELEALVGLVEVTSIEEDMLATPTLAQSVPLIGGTSAWSSGFTGAGKTVAILDTGVEKTHTFLAGKVVSEACYSTTGTTTTSVCPGGVAASTSAGSAVPCPMPGCDHGTHVAGIAAGNSASFSGVAKDASVIAVQVFSNITASNSPASFSSDQILGLERVLALNGTYAIAAVNMSLGGGRFFSSCDSGNLARKAAIDNLRSAGIATVISSGNDGYSDSMGQPGCISTAVSVGATWDAAGFSNTCAGNSLGTSTVDAVTCYSNSVSFLNLLAPGSSINSSVVAGGFGGKGGTSMAAPHVAGAWALLKQKKGTLTVAEGLAALGSTGLAITDPRNGIVKPRIQLVAALASIGPEGTNSLFVSKAGTGSGTVTSAPAGISCGATCNASYASGTSVVLTATNAVGSSFTGWSGGCTGTGTCTVTMSTVQIVTATFALPLSGEVFPPGCQMPAGWTVPATANSGWSVVSNTASVGTCSLKSNTIADSQKAQIQFAGAFTAGNITFDRRVSSEGGFDCFRFFVDGVQKSVGGTCASVGGLGASGEVAWGPVSVPVSAGMRTLIWSYEKDSSASAGQDAAWIDSVVLPLAPKKSIPAIFMFLMD